MHGDGTVLSPEELLDNQNQRMQRRSCYQPCRMAHCGFHCCDNTPGEAGCAIDDPCCRRRDAEIGKRLPKGRV